MQVLISTIGSRGEVQPALALALALRARGHSPRLCVPPNFKSWIESFGVTCLTAGPDVQKAARQLAAHRRVKPSREQLRELARLSVRDQFEALTEAARGCDLMVVAGSLQTAGHSVAEALRIPYVYAAYCACALRSAAHPPPKIRARIRSQSLPRLVNRFLWMRDERSWNLFFRAAVNEQRSALGLPGIGSVPRYVSTDRPWLAADPVLGPAASAAGLEVLQTGAWLLGDPSPLPTALERFLEDGEPPTYFGFGSMQAAAATSRTLIEAARSLGRRAIISQGWGQLDLIDSGVDCISIADVNHTLLFASVGAIVHHGGAGTTTAAARAGKPQIVVPHMYDQFYWAKRVERLGVGVPGPSAARLDVAALARALRAADHPEMAERARSLASRIELHGADKAAERLSREFG
jgi:vancomycin aglycone glucosyltransferase